MKALLVSAAAIGLLSAAPAFAQAGPVASTNGTADATIVNPISVAQASGGELKFGTLAGQAGTIEIDPDGTVTPSSPNLYVSGTQQPASFIVSGQTGLHYTPSLPLSSVVITDGTNNMTVSALTISDAPVGGHVVGTDNFKVGGTLTVNAGQVAGSYSGQFAVNVQYD